ncbi:DUF6345 domain-containing protein [Kribbella sp. NPDC023855]|uniref:DUF6345 domain-containing protein n=1 Tax=Kribbella sp. NPDC023855 TaxID=3154698 RepID=UPI0033DB2580
MTTLPIFRTSFRRPEVDDLLDCAARLFRISDHDQFTMTTDESMLALSSATHSVELSRASGGLWAADKSQLFNADLTPDLPSEDEAVSEARTFMESAGLLPSLTGSATWGELLTASSRVVTLTEGGRTEVLLDRQIVFPVVVDGLPVVGGGGDFTLAFGDGGRPIGLHGVWREIHDSFSSAALPAEQIDEIFREELAAQGVKTTAVSQYLAFYSAPAFDRQDFLYPVYVMGGTGVFGDREVPLRLSMFPATEFGPKRSLPAPERIRRSKIGARRSTGRDAEAKHVRRGYNSGASRQGARVVANPFEAGASWIGSSGGLAGSKKNAQGFIDQWRDDGWNINFNWGDGNAWESDWRRNDDTWVDAADFVFYTGHADMNGWTLASPDDGSLQFNEVGGSPGNPGDLWGENDLEWLVVAACGPLQDELLSKGGGDVLSRWDGAFDGLHLLMGYGAITFDNESEGRTLAAYARQGQTLKDAWFRTAKEIQPASNGEAPPNGPTVWVGVMWVTRLGVDPINDHAWNHGSVAADPTSPTSLSCMWTVC